MFGSADVEVFQISSSSQIFGDMSLSLRRSLWNVVTALALKKRISDRSQALEAVRQIVGLWLRHPESVNR